MDYDQQVEKHWSDVDERRRTFAARRSRGPDADDRPAEIYDRLSSLIRRLAPGRSGRYRRRCEDRSAPDCMQDRCPVEPIAGAATLVVCALFDCGTRAIQRSAEFRSI